MRKYHTCNLSRHSITLVHKKHRNKLRTPIKQFCVEHEKDLLRNGNRDAFHKYVKSQLCRTHSRPQLRLNGVELIDSQAVNALFAKFCSKFAASNFDEHHSTDLLIYADSDQLLLLNCTLTDIKLALAQCVNSSASSDGVSFKFIKAISAELTLLLLITYQQIFSHGKSSLS